ncbi:MAG TPA: hypothetical protein VKB78_12025, partial [Pirellulales bacterium]|nr:hypothetical protein [Pirellulales bacterium]
MRRWRIELGGQNVVLLRIAKQGSIHQRRSLTLARQLLTYDFSPRGLQLSAELKLDVLGEPIRQLALEIDSPLTLVTARYGDTQLPWYEEKAAGEGLQSPPESTDKVVSSDNDDGVPYPSTPRVHRIIVQLAEPLRGPGRIVRIEAVAPLPSSGRLPTVRPGSPEVVWQEGTTLLLVPLPRELSELRTIGCRQIKRESLPAPSQGDALTFQFFRADADLFIGLRRRQGRFQIHSGITIDVRDESMSGRMIADLTAQRGETFSLSADIVSPWIIDSVDSSPSGSIANWSVDSLVGGQQRLTIGLAKSLRVDRPLQLLVGGHWPRAPLGETLHVPKFVMI